MYDPFSQIPAEPSPQVVEKTVYVPAKPNYIFGIEDKLFMGVLIGIIIANFIAEMK